ncbi:phosphotransferase [Agromyces sp. PvR057]|uniref:phosphotransferase n=1 Tax=Agromyces sp. PvR057 TaxID=3156403 RepID=UPI00339625DA
MGDGRTREVELVLCLPSGEVLGTTPVLTAAEPWLPFARPVVAAARTSLGLEVIVLRLLDVDRRPNVTPDLVRYLAEIEAVPPIELSPVSAADAAVTAPEALRMPWAEPEGPTRVLQWAEAELAARGIALTGRPGQVKSWNLSNLWMLPTAAGTVWLKQVPPFFAHEGAVIERMSRHAVPRLIARRGDAALLAEIAGEDLFVSTGAQREAMIDLLVDLQRDTVGSIEELLGMGLPDWRLPAIAESGSHALEASADELGPEQRAAVSTLIDGLDVRARRIEACGLPDTLVHGDFHTGNLRGIGLELTLLDWGDSGVGHPLLDEAAFTERLTPTDRDSARAHWTQVWSRAVPGSDPAEALRLLGPVAALRQAIIYRGFLDRIEPDERVYHRDDPGTWLVRTADLLAAETADR